MTKIKEDQTHQDLVSIITPAYNCEDFIQLTIESVLAQSYCNWEMIIVDDCSLDNTREIIMQYQKKDSRIKYFKLDENSGAAAARNEAIKKASGDYIAFLDSDDIWFPNKLETQVNFMKEKSYNFTCTSYNKIDDHGTDLNRIIKAKEKSDYNGVLRTCPGNSTVIYNAKELGKFIIPNIKKRNDYVMWLQVIKKEHHLYGINDVLGSHRIRNNALSKNKFSLVKYHWEVYRNIEKLSLLKSLSLEAYWIIMTVFKLR